MAALSHQETGTASGATLAPWPLAVLDVPGLRRSGLRPTALRQFILKVHSRCNLSCTYCYIYHAADTSWRSHPARVSSDTMRWTALRIAEHVARHRLSEVRIDLHGGEPLMSGPEAVLEYMAAVRAAMPADCTVRASVQTNGTMLTEPGLTELTRAGVRVGLSLDGGNAALNHRRVDHAGRSSWPAAERAARLLARHPETYAGLLCTVDLDADPAGLYSSLAELRPPMIDLLLPHANWTNPPPGLPVRAPEAVRTSAQARAPYGDWLAAVFDLWWDADRSERPHPRVRLFTEILALLLGVPSTTESVGLSPVAAIIVETDGGIEQLDSLKNTYEGATRTGLDVVRDSFDEVLDHPGVAARQLGITALGPACRSCPVMRVCGGGSYAHRYREGSGFRHPSVYCADLERLIRHIATRLAAAVPPLSPSNRRTA
jgi:uncharacterized protein